MPLAFLFDDGLEVGRDGFPQILVHRNPGDGNGDDGADHIVGDFVPADAGAAGAAGYGGVQHAAFQGGVHIGEGHKLGVGAHAAQQVAEDGAVAAGFQSLKVGQGIEGARGEVVVALVVVLHNDDAVGLFLDDAMEVSAGSVNDGEVGFGVREQAPKVGDVNDGQVAADVAGVDFGEFHSLVFNQTQGIGAGQTEFGERADLENDAAVGAVLDALDEAVDAVFLLGGVDEGAGVAGAVDADELDFEFGFGHHCAAAVAGAGSGGGRGVSGGRGFGSRRGGRAGGGGRRGGSRGRAAAAARRQYHHQRAEQAGQQIFAEAGVGECSVDAMIHFPFPPILPGFRTLPGGRQILGESAGAVRLHFSPPVAPAQDGRRLRIEPPYSNCRAIL